MFYNLHPVTLMLRLLLLLKTANNCCAFVFKIYLFACYMWPYMRSFVLVLMTVDRFIDALPTRHSMTRKAALISVIIGMIICCLANAPNFPHYRVMQQSTSGDADVFNICFHKVEGSHISGFVSTRLNFIFNTCSLGPYLPSP